MAAAMLAPLALGACGRKGPLDPPPTGLTTPPAYTSRPSLGEESEGFAPPALGMRPRAQAAPPPAPPPEPPKSFFLDFLLAK